MADDKAWEIDLRLNENLIKLENSYRSGNLIVVEDATHFIKWQLHFTSIIGNNRYFDIVDGGVIVEHINSNDVIFVWGNGWREIRGASRLPTV